MPSAPVAHKRVAHTVFPKPPIAGGFLMDASMGDGCGVTSYT